MDHEGDELFEQFIRASAPAKLNLRLKIVGRRSDDYHLLSMLNSTIDLVDTLEVRFRPERGVRLSVSGTLADEVLAGLSQTSDNLVVRAAEAFADRWLPELGLDIHLVKRIPIGAGLGGGSSDAGTLLKILRDQVLHSSELMARFKVSQGEVRKEISAIALELGADVPYFLEGGLAWVQGIGEDVRPIPEEGLRGKPGVLLVPPDQQETTAVYGEYRFRNPTIANEDDQFVELFVAELGSLPAEDRYDQLLSGVENDLESVVCARSPLTARALESVRGVSGVVASITGSGSGILALPRSIGQDGLAALERVWEAAGALDAQRFRIRLLEDAKE